MPTFPTWNEARAYAESEAARTGLAYGITKPGPLDYGRWPVIMLPRPENRAGHELRCEAVEPPVVRK